MNCPARWLRVCVAGVVGAVLGAETLGAATVDKSRPQSEPPQVRGLKVFHGAGQTFFTFREVDPLSEKSEVNWGELKQALAEATDACRYRIYALNLPISAENITKADLVAEVEPLSGYNVGGRNMEYLIGQAMLQPDELGELARDYNGYMYTWDMDHPRMDRYPVARFVVDQRAGPIPPGTGLYVHHPASAGSRYYAVVSCRGGLENRVDFSRENTAGPIRETVGPGEPVHQGPGLWGPYFDYPGRRQVYVQWCAPPLAPRPNMAFNWSVLVPPGVDPGRKVPLELHLHSGNFSYAKPRQKYLRDSIQMAPHDYPFSGWYGFNDAYGTDKDWRQGVVRNHTQKRILAFLDWAQNEFPIDPDRVILCGSDGAAAMAMRYRERFAYVLIERFGGSGKVQGRVLDPEQEARFASAWGPKCTEIRDEQGRANWGWAMLDQVALERPEEPMPLIVCEGTSWGGVRQYGKGYGPFYANMQEAHQPLIAGFGWDTKLIVPGWYTGMWQPRRHRDAPGLDLTRHTPVPAFANSSGSVEKLQWGNVNWMHTWSDVKDEPDGFQITLAGSGTVDMTPRRLQKLKIRPGETLHWTVEPLPHPREKTPPAPQSGVVTADGHGLVTLKQVEIPQGGVVVRITRTK